MLRSIDITRLLHYELNLNDRKLIALFGETLGRHMWSKFLKTNCNLLRFFGQIQTQHIQTIVDAINNSYED